MTPASRFGFVEVVCRRTLDGGTEALVAYELTALNDHGSSFLDGFTPSGFAAMIEEWKALINAWLHDNPGKTAPH